MIMVATGPLSKHEANTAIGKSTTTSMLRRPWPVSVIAAPVSSASMVVGEYDVTEATTRERERWREQEVSLEQTDPST